MVLCVLCAVCVVCARPQLICEIIGSPTAADLHFVTSDAARNYMMRQPKCAPVPLASVFPHVRGPCLDLVERMLKFDPAKRITVDVRARVRGVPCVGLVLWRRSTGGAVGHADGTLS